MPDDALAETYAAARERFLAAAAAADLPVVSHLHPDRGPDGEELALDAVRVGPEEAPALAVVVSGTHGVEGFAGSCCQSRWLERGGPDGLPPGVAVLVVHAHNPWGFAWVRRVDEGNVDVNRNAIDFDHPPENPGYDELAEALAPEDWSAEAQEATGALIGEWVATHGLEAAQPAISGGQYRHPDGLYYGGSAPCWSLRTMRAVLAEHATAAEQVAVLDLHTGLGRFGEVELISHEPPGTPAFDRSRRWWGDRVASNAGGDSISSSLHGEWLPAAQRWLAPAEVTAATPEWGTVDLIQVLQALRTDNWLHAHGDPTGPDAAPIKAQVRAAFAPDDPAWIELVWEAFEEILDATLAALTR